MKKFYFVSYIEVSAYSISSIYKSDDKKMIFNNFTDVHPLLWEIQENNKRNKIPQMLSSVNLIWWKELNEEEIQLIKDNGIHKSTNIDFWK